MVTAQPLPLNPATSIDMDMRPRRAASVAAIDARLSVWGQAAREGLSLRAQAMSRGGALWGSQVGRAAESVRSTPVDASEALLGSNVRAMALLCANLMSSAIRPACRILWVDPDRLEEKLLEGVAPNVEAAKNEIRRRQALYRRRARLWKADPERLNQLRDEVESLTVPRGGQLIVEGVRQHLERVGIILA